MGLYQLLLFIEFKASVGFLGHQKYNSGTENELQKLWKVCSWEQSSASDSLTVLTMQLSKTKHYRIGTFISLS